MKSIMSDIGMILMINKDTMKNCFFLAISKGKTGIFISLLELTSTLDYHDPIIGVV